MVSWRVSGENQQAIQQVVQRYNQTCGEWTADNLPDVDDEVHISTQRSTDTLTGETNFYHFQLNLLIHSRGIESLDDLAD